MNNLSDYRTAHAELLTERPRAIGVCSTVSTPQSRCPPISNFAHVEICKLVSAILLPSDTRSQPSPVAAVLNIFLLGVCIKMRWIATRRIVARMTNVKPLWYFSIFQSISNSWRQFGSVIKHEPSIASWAFCRQPRPALVRRAALHFLPKPLFGRFIPPTHTAGQYRNLLMAFWVDLEPRFTTWVLFWHLFNMPPTENWVNV